VSQSGDFVITKIRYIKMVLFPVLYDTNNNFSYLMKKCFMHASVLLFAVQCNLYFDSHNHSQIPSLGVYYILYSMLVLNLLEVLK